MLVWVCNFYNTKKPPWIFPVHQLALTSWVFLYLCHLISISLHNYMPLQRNVNCSLYGSVKGVLVHCPVIYCQCHSHVNNPLLCLHLCRQLPLAYCSEQPFYFSKSSLLTTIIPIDFLESNPLYLLNSLPRLKSQHEEVNYN